MKATVNILQEMVQHQTKQAENLSLDCWMCVTTTAPPLRERPHWVPALTTLLFFVSPSRLSEGHGGSEVCPQHGPAEGGHGVDANQAPDEGAPAAPQQGHDIGPHVVSVLLPEILRAECRTIQHIMLRSK